MEGLQGSLSDHQQVEDEVDDGHKDCGGDHFDLVPFVLTFLHLVEALLLRVFLLL